MFTYIFLLPALGVLLLGLLFLIVLCARCRPREDDMISLNYRDARPIKEPGRDGRRRLIVSGAIADGEKLPSVRALASQLAINPNTIQRAYSELESEGYAASVPGKGSFAVRRERAEDDGRRLALTETLRETLRELRALGMTTAELDAIYREEEEK